MPTTMRRAGYAILIAGALGGLLNLAGCSLLSGGPAYPERYTLQTGDSAAVSTAAPATDAVLDLRRVSAPDWLNSRRMLYRLDYVDDSALAAYTRSAWAATPAHLVGEALDDTLSRAGLFSAVIDDDTPGQADLALQLELNDFSQHFSSRQSSRARIEVKATLLHAATGRVLGQKNFSLTAPAPTGDAAGGVIALSNADTALARQLVSWLGHTLQRCSRACRAGHS